MTNKYFFLCLLLGIGASQARADLMVLYDNTKNDTGYTDGFAVNGLVEAGDEITLSGDLGAFATSAEIGLYNSAPTNGLADVTLRLYSASGSTLGPQLFAATAANLLLGAQTNTYYTFKNIFTYVPGTLVWTLSYATTAAIAPELLDFDPPVTGTSDNTTVWWDKGSGLTLTTPGYDTENYYFELTGTQVPEPQTWTFLASGLGALMLLGLKRSRRIRIDSWHTDWRRFPCDF